MQRAGVLGKHVLKCLWQEEHVLSHAVMSMELPLLEYFLEV